jgi:hypothetical protein
VCAAEWPQWRIMLLSCLCAVLWYHDVQDDHCRYQGAAVTQIHQSATVIHAQLPMEKPDMHSWFGFVLLLLDMTSGESSRQHQTDGGAQLCSVLCCCTLPGASRHADLGLHADACAPTSAAGHLSQVVVTALLRCA